MTLPNPVMTASGTAGHGAELVAYFDLSALGAVVVKSMSADPWPGNPAPRLHPSRGGDAELASASRARASTPGWPTTCPPWWPRGPGSWHRSGAARSRGSPGRRRRLADAPPAVVAVEVNVSCPNLEARDQLFAHSPTATAEVLAATAACGRPRWAKLSPNTDRLVEVAAAAAEAGAEAVTLVNTVVGMAIDPVNRRPVLGAGRGGLSGPAIHPVAVRAVYDVRAALPDLPIVGVGGVSDAGRAVELLLAGAQAVQVGTATFADPRAPPRVAEDLARWCRRHGVARVSDLVRRRSPRTHAHVDAPGTR